MALIDDVWTHIGELAANGWNEIFEQIGLNLTAADPGTELARRVAVDRSLAGFGDFVADEAAFVEPADPTSSLLYHAFASPNVGVDRPVHPTLAQINTLENYIFAAAKRSLDQVLENAADRLGVDLAEMEVAVSPFAVEYRSGAGTPHEKFADLCFSRTGVSRVGTHEAAFYGPWRAYSAHLDGDDEVTIRTVPCRFSAYLAVRAFGDRRRFGPMKPINTSNRNDLPDSVHSFWVPVHKLFDGDECLAGTTISVAFSGKHWNQKLAKLHKRIAGVAGAPSPDELNQPPYTMTVGIADLETSMNGAAVVAPNAAPLARMSEVGGEALTFKAPAMTTPYSDAFRPTLSLGSGRGGGRPWPEFAHVRTEKRNGTIMDLETDPEVNANAETFLDYTAEGGYDAVSYHDASGDGWVVAEVTNGDSTALGGSDGRPFAALSACSIVAAPDFYPGVNQRALGDWWQKTQKLQVDVDAAPWLRSLYKDEGWEDVWVAPPDDLASLRIAANTKLPERPFEIDDRTLTAVLTMPRALSALDRTRLGRTPPRQTTLPDGAAGIFAPGWDVSRDYSFETRDPKSFFAGYGLGSPFPEDAKLCAALSTFWPAAAPDSTRTFVDVHRYEPGDLQLGIVSGGGTVCPMTDEELGVGPGAPAAWDGVTGPHVVDHTADRLVVSYPIFARADYTLNARDGRFSIAKTAQVDLRAYKERMVAMGRCYLAHGSDRGLLHIYSFRLTDTASDEVAPLLTRFGLTWSPDHPVYRFELFEQSAILSERLTERQTRIELEVGVTSTVLVGVGRSVLVGTMRGDGSGVPVDWRPEHDA